MGRTAFWEGERLKDLLSLSIEELQTKYPGYSRQHLQSTKRYWRIKMERQPVHREPKVLLHDIEAGPNLGYVYGKWETNVQKFEKQWELMAYGFKWLGKRAIEVYAQDEYTEEELLAIAHEALSEADVVIGHNSNGFDNKMLNAKFLEFGFDPPAPYRSVDTLQVAKRYFRFTSNSLKDLAEKLDVERKAELGGFSVWLACINGDQKAWNKLKRYNRQDVVVLEDIYIRMRPWIENHPPMNILSGQEGVCPKCMSQNMQPREKFKANATTTVERFQCGDCGGWSQSRTSIRRNPRYK
jgi:DNA polymerase elongation subunit (family B)